jgi:cell wall-associated NlpC family hydrolase
MINKEVENRENASELSKESAGMIEDLLSEAKRYIGRPYVHGAKGPNAFDCSGFTSYIYKQFGYSISPSSRAQYTYGESVDRKSLRKGDLVFFTSRNSGKNVGHVGIVYSVDNETGSFKFIHASISGVKISDFAGYYVSRYIGAKRLIQK